ncbi:MAG TPA: M28 family peptidase [Balneolaceae bacterium]|nr:M28 family peptidase [Balneolaceae bacterium]
MVGLFFSLLIASCSSDNSRLHFEDQGQPVPVFNADSAYHFVEKQVAFGPRTPDSKAHLQAKKYLLNKLKSYAGSRSVFPQEFSSAGYDGDTLAMTNIIAAFNPKSGDRVMLSAHWDSRPQADQDTVDADKPILGADDGGSGVAVLLELARLFRDNPPPLGVDIVLFDGEDYGKEGDLSKYFLGSRYWAKNPPVKGYSPRFGILLDMVGGQMAEYPKEQNSMQFAPALVNELWSIADEKGYTDLFVDQKGGIISDDHVIINRILNIPMIDIIDHEPASRGAKFPPYWHTHRDNMDIISKKTLKGTGQVLAELIYNRLAHKQ